MLDLQCSPQVHVIKACACTAWHCWWWVAETLSWGLVGHTVVIKGDVHGEE